MKKFIIFIAIFLCAFLFPFDVISADRNDIQILSDYGKSKNIRLMGKEGINYHIKKTKDGSFARMILRVDISELKDYVYEIHFIEMNYNIDGKIDKLVTETRYVHDCDSPGCYTYEQWILVDYFGDGVIERTIKDFVIVGKDIECIKGYDLELGIRYPEKFRNMEWYNSSDGESQKKFDNEIEFWLKNLKYPEE